ncbi:MAG: hypothetical protein COB67_08990, partial [SAR324 cluster bacterium]
IGILDPSSSEDVLGVPIIGGDEKLSELRSQGVKYAFPAVGFGERTNNSFRQKIFNKIKEEGFEIPNLISSKAFVRSEVKMGVGNLIQAGSVIDTRAELGDNIAIGFNVLIGHNCVIENHVTFSGGVILNGGVRVGEGTFLGMGSILYRDSGKWSKISPGTACLEPVPEKKIAFGNPVRFLPNIQI